MTARQSAAVGRGGVDRAEWTITRPLAETELIFRRRYSITESIGDRTATTIALVDVVVRRVWPPTSGGPHAQPPQLEDGEGARDLGAGELDRRFNLRRQFHAWRSQVNWVSRYHFGDERRR